jgi:formate-dependent phosphoribosylglycinamide formyltransferase (GAR transformylase)
LCLNHKCFSKQPKKERVGREEAVTFPSSVTMLTTTLNQDPQFCDAVEHILRLKLFSTISLVKSQCSRQRVASAVVGTSPPLLAVILKR